MSISDRTTPAGSVTDPVEPVSLISQTAEYALRAVVCLASQPDRPMVTPLIAEVTHVPAGYLSKVLQTLGRSGIVQSQRGLHGGFVLARPAAELTVLDVVNAVDPMKRILECPLGLKQHGRRLCPLHRQLDDAMAEVERALGSHSIQALISEPEGSVPLGLTFDRPAQVRTHDVGNT